ncbi:hypothetical protein Vi05172_g4166 [Venturia inaequalis]|nr:hypothetical protein Vi05172_g4166 [Venturia inaequalis]
MAYAQNLLDLNVFILQLFLTTILITTACVPVLSRRRELFYSLDISWVY